MGERGLVDDKKRLVTMVVFASGAVLLLAGVTVLAIGWQPMLGAGLLLAGAMDIGLGLFLGTR